jgi:muconolactone delta-isomerase
VQITVTLPDDMAAPLVPQGQEPARAALEALALEAYRQRRITGYQLRTLLGISSRYELDGFLKQHEVFDYTVDDFDRDLATIRELNDKRKSERSE